MKTARQVFKEAFWIGAKGGLLDQKHIKAMGDAVWLFLYFLRGQTGINEWSEGIFEYGHPITLGKISSDFGGTSRETIKRWLAVLKGGDYIRSEFHSNHGTIFWIAKAKDKTKKPRVTASVHRKSTHVHANSSGKPARSVENSSGEVPPEFLNSSGESPQSRETNLVQSSDNQVFAEIAGDSIPKGSIPKNPFYYNTHAASPNISSLLMETARKLQPQEKPLCLEERQRQLQEQSKAILAKYPDSGKRTPTWKEIRSMGYGPLQKDPGDGKWDGQGDC